MNIGMALAFIGAALAVGLACAGSAKGVGSVGEVGAGVLAEDPGKFSQILILQIVPGTQGLYGLVAWFFALMKLGFFSGSLVSLDLNGGLMYLAACLPMAIGGLRVPHRKAVRGAVQGHHHGHHGGILRHPLPAGILPDAEQPERPHRLSEGGSLSIGRGPAHERH